MKIVMKKVFPGVVAIVMVGTASADVPLFAAKCPSGITADSNTRGQVYINGKVAKLIKRPDGQITAQSAGVSWVAAALRPSGARPAKCSAATAWPVRSG